MLMLFTHVLTCCLANTCLQLFSNVRCYGTQHPTTAAACTFLGSMLL
jgi:hypothetical protein